MIDLEQISNLKRGPEGIWVAPQQHGVSFPTDGNAMRKDAEAQSFWYIHRNRCLIALMNNFPPKGHLLDIGGGNGTVGTALQQAGYPTILMEPEWAAAIEGRVRGISEVISSTLIDAGFKPQTLPAVGLFDVLEHIEDDFGFLSMLHTLLVPKGKLYLTVPAYQFLWSESDGEAGHFRRYTCEGLNGQLERTGFRVQYATYFFSVLILPVFLYRTVPSLLRFRHLPGGQWRHKHHRGTESLQGKILLRLLKRELAYIRVGKRIPMGTSCVVVAERV